MTCVTASMFAVNVNSEPKGFFFPAGRGLDKVIPCLMYRGSYSRASSCHEEEFVLYWCVIGLFLEVL